MEEQKPVKIYLGNTLIGETPATTLRRQKLPRKKKKAYKNMGVAYPFELGGWNIFRFQDEQDK